MLFQPPLNSTWEKKKTKNTTRQPAQPFKCVHTRICVYVYNNIYIYIRKEKKYTAHKNHMHSNVRIHSDTTRVTGKLIRYGGT